MSSQFKKEADTVQLETNGDDYAIRRAVITIRAGAAAR